MFIYSIVESISEGAQVWTPVFPSLEAAIAAVNEDIVATLGDDAITLTKDAMSLYEDEDSETVRYTAEGYSCDPDAVLIITRHEVKF